MAFKSDNYSLRRADYATAVTTSDSANIANPATKGLYIGGAGDVKVDTAHASAVVFKAVPVGTILPVLVLKVYATGTTATNIVALY